MRTDKMTRKLKNPYVLLKRCNLEDINHYGSRGEVHFSLDSAPRQPNTANGNCGPRLFRAYVLLERLTAHDIQILMNKKSEE